MKPLSVSKDIEIAASPETVRSVFLDFPRYHEWHQGWSIEPVEAGKKPMDLKSGDKLNFNLQGMKMHPRVAENTPNFFAWDGSFYGIIGARHEFTFAPSEKNPGGTTFTQGEDWMGAVMVLLWPWRNREWDSPNFTAFNNALKKEVERLVSERTEIESR